MFINKNSLSVTVGNTTINLGKYITEAKYGYNKLWSSGSGRNMAGTQSGTLIGIFPKITVQFRRLNKSEIEEISKILDTPYQNLTYYDPFKEMLMTISTYTGDWEVTNRGILKNEGFSCSFISRRKRS